MYDMAEEIDDTTAEGYMLQAAADKAGCKMEELCFSCEKQKRKYVTGLCQECHDVAMKADTDAEGEVTK